MKRSMTTTLTVLILLLTQPLLPVAVPTSGASDEQQLDLGMSDADLQKLSRIGINPVFDAEHGWGIPSDGQVAWLRHRDAGMLSIEEWNEETISGWALLQHEYPVPTSWFNELALAGIECQSFLPPSSFHCRLSGQSISVDWMFDKSKYIQKIDACLEAQSMGDISLNSFAKQFVTNLKAQAEAAESEEEVKEILNRLYTITDCEP